MGAEAWTGGCAAKGLREIEHVDDDRRDVSWCRCVQNLGVWVCNADLKRGQDVDESVVGEKITRHASLTVHTAVGRRPPITTSIRTFRLPE